MNNKEPVKLTTTNALQSEFDEPDVKITHKNCNLQQNFVLPDGGTRAWLIMVFSFLCNGVIFGTINSSGSSNYSISSGLFGYRYYIPFVTNFKYTGG